MPFWPHFNPLLAPFWLPKSIKFRPGTKNVTFAFWASRLDESSTLGVQGPQKPPKVPPKAIKKSIKFQLWFFSDFWCQNGPKMTPKWGGGKVTFSPWSPPLEPPAVQEGPSDPPKLTFGAKMVSRGPPGTQKACQNDPQGTPETQKYPKKDPQNTKNKLQKKQSKTIPQMHPNRICTRTWTTSPANQKTKQLKQSK